MMRKFTIVMLSVLLGLSCVSCGATGDNPAPKSSVSSETKSSERSKADSSVVSHVDSSTAVTSGSSSEADAQMVLTEINRYVLTPGDEYYLNEDREEGYKKALDAVISHEDQVQLTDSYDDNLAILGYLQQSPYTFVLSDFDITKNHKGMWFEYKYPAEECKEKMDFIDSEYLTLLNDIITPDMTELEKVLAVHRYFSARIAYDHDWVDALNMSDEKYLFPDIVIYEALNTDKGVCHTYTYLCEFAFQQLGIKCTRASSEMTDSDDGHMWLIVWIDDVPYHVDPTWDRNGDVVSLKYFGMTDAENCDRGIKDEWAASIDSALDITCSDERFADWRDITDYELTGDHKMKVIREDGSEDLINLMDYE